MFGDHLSEPVFFHYLQVTSLGFRMWVLAVFGFWLKVSRIEKKEKPMVSGSFPSLPKMIQSYVRGGFSEDYVGSEIPSSFSRAGARSSFQLKPLSLPKNDPNKTLGLEIYLGHTLKTRP